MTELPWIAEARRHIGLREIPGPKTNSVIAGWLMKLKAWWSDDATPWCGTSQFWTNAKSVIPFIRHLL